MLLTGPFPMLSMPSFDFHLPPCTEGFLIHLSPAIATLAIATVSLGGTISLCIRVNMEAIQNYKQISVDIN